MPKRLPCDDLAAFVAGELSEGMAAAFRKHLKRCEACANGVEATWKRAPFPGGAQ